MNPDLPTQPTSADRASAEPSMELHKLGVRLGVKHLQPASQTHKRGHSLGVESVVPGEVLQTPHGPCFVVERRYPLDHAHGQHRLSALRPSERPSPLLARLAGDERASELDYQSAIFFDIETTGLGIGSGMYAFMVGLGTFEQDGFCLRQYFMRDYNEEEALLHLLDRQVRQRSWWVSFNGRYFDLPVLQARFTCARRELPLAQAPHLDLLYPARKLWRRRLTSCALSSLEAGVLGVTRESDVPGWLIPELYFEYVRHGAVAPLPQIFLHNALDILSLVTLAARANSLLCSPPGETVQHAADMYSLAVIHESHARHEEAQHAYQQALQQGLPPALEEEALHRLSLLYKRSHQIEQATHLWQVLREKNRPSAYVALAKDCEHRQRDYQAAARLVCEALALETLPAKGECSAEGLRSRLARLRTKMGEGVQPMPHIESYSFGKVRVDGMNYTADLLILPGGVRPGWWRQEGHSLHSDDLRDVVEAKPSVLVIGTGNPGMMKVPQETLDFLTGHGIRTEVHPSAAACQRYNELGRTEQAAAALHLTC